MEQAKVFEFRNVSDFFELTPKEFERFLDDFKIWFAHGKSLQAMEKILGKTEGFEGFDVKISLPEVIRWTDDGKAGVKRLRIKNRRFVNDELVEEKNFKIEVTEE